MTRGNIRSTPSRRSFLVGAAGGMAALPWIATTTATTTQVKPKGKEALPVQVISSDNGMAATRRAYERLVARADTLDAAIEGVSLVEDDPNDRTVGLGGLPNEDGVVELDAAVMHGPTHRAGAVAAMQRIRNPSQVARLVMQRSDHVLLVGDGALRFALAHGFVEENLLTEVSRKIWLHWRETHSSKDDWLPPPEGAIEPEVTDYFKRHTGTIHCAALNASGDISCVTSTSGLAFKIAGRVGDSPIVGAGLYVDNAVGSCGSTGRGEANLQNLSSFAAVELMRSGMSPRDAGMEILRRVVERTEPRLRDAQGRPTFDVKFYLLAKDGRRAGVAMWGPAKYAVTDANGSRLEECVAMYQRQK